MQTNPYSFWVTRMGIILQEDIIADSVTAILPFKHPCFLLPVLLRLVTALIKVLLVENRRSSTKITSPIRQELFCFFTLVPFFPNLGFSGLVIKRKSCLQSWENCNTDRLHLWGFVSSLRGFLSVSWVIPQNCSALWKANVCKGGWVWEWRGGIKPDWAVLVSTAGASSGHGKRTCCSMRRWLQSHGHVCSICWGGPLIDSGWWSHQGLVPSLALCWGLELTLPNPQSKWRHWDRKGHLFHLPGKQRTPPVLVHHHGTVQLRMDTARALCSPCTTQAPEAKKLFYVFSIGHLPMPPAAAVPLSSQSTPPLSLPTAAPCSFCWWWKRFQKVHHTAFLVHVLFMRRNWNLFERERLLSSG